MLVIYESCFFLGKALNVVLYGRKYHPGAICHGVTNPLTINALSGCDNLNTPEKN